MLLKVKDSQINNNISEAPLQSLCSTLASTWQETVPLQKYFWKININDLVQQRERKRERESEREAILTICNSFWNHYLFLQNVRFWLPMKITWEINGFLIFSGGIKREHWVEMGLIRVLYELKVFKDGPSKVYGRQPLKDLKWYGLLRHFDPYISSDGCCARFWSVLLHVISILSY